MELREFREGFGGLQLWERLSCVEVEALSERVEEEPWPLKLMECADGL